MNKPALLKEFFTFLRDEGYELGNDADFLIEKFFKEGHGRGVS